MDLLVLRRREPDGERSPELRYLFSYCLLQAREAFDRVEVLTVEEGRAPAVPGACDAVLLLASGNVLIARRSLEAMHDRLRAGASEVRPRRLADGGLGAQRPVYTLRGYERLESLFLASAPAAPVPTSHLPVSLLSSGRFRRVTAEVSLDRLLSDPDSLPADPETASAGLYHEFIDYYGEVRSDVLPFIPEGAREVLEIGCGRGATGRLIQERLGCRVTGVELNPVVAGEAARHLHRVLEGDIETLEIAGRYDAVVALELVEHLVETERFLARVRQLLAPGGRAIFSIPNVGHYSVVEDLIAGRWDYLPIGLLCYTHFRFFTRRTLSDWLRRSGIESFELVPQPTEPPERPERFTSAFETDLESLATKGFYVLVHG
jgi:SAM-dependent methyltransferase